jgi:cellulose biosynthesis protein BcsQ
MTIITVASSKGGPGKTTLAQILVGNLAAEGVTVAALDADPTGGLSRWASRLYEGAAFASTKRKRPASPISSTAWLKRLRWWWSTPQASATEPPRWR